jgi:hypothetical protein
MVAEDDSLGSRKDLWRGESQSGTERQREQGYDEVAMTAVSCGRLWAHGPPSVPDQVRPGRDGVPGMTLVATTPGTADDG